LGSVEAEHT